MVVRRYLFALDMDKAIDRVAISCHHCASLRQIPHTVIEQSTAASPDAVGISFAADVIKRHRQLILVLWECVTSFTTTTLLEDERHQSLRDALVRLCIELRPLDGPPAVIRTDPAPSFKALTNDLMVQISWEFMLNPIAILLCLWLQEPVICPKSNKVDAVDKQPLNGFNHR